MRYRTRKACGANGGATQSRELSAAASSSSTVLRRGGGAGGCGAGGYTGGTHHSAAATVLARSNVTPRNGFNLGPRFRPTDICVCAGCRQHIYDTPLEALEKGGTRHSPCSRRRAGVACSLRVNTSPIALPGGADTETSATAQPCKAPLRRAIGQGP